MEMVKWKDVLGRGHLLMEGKGDDVFHVIPDQRDEEGNSFTQILSKKAMLEFISKTQNEECAVDDQ